MIDNPALDRQMRHDDAVSSYESQYERHLGATVHKLETNPEYLRQYAFDYTGDPMADLLSIVTSEKPEKAVAEFIEGLARAITDRKIGTYELEAS